MPVVMDRRHFIRQTAGGWIASLLALTGKYKATALDQLAASLEVSFNASVLDRVI
jgi:hypothetical protein